MGGLYITYLLFNLTFYYLLVTLSLRAGHQLGHQLFCLLLQLLFYILV